MKLFFILLVMVASVCHAKTVTYEYNFDTPEVFSFNGQDTVYVEHLAQTITPGMPILPVKLAKIVLPANVKVLSVNSVRLSSSKLSSNLNLKVSKGTTPITTIGENKATLKFEDLIFTDSYPSAMTYGSVQKFHGYNVLLAKLFPVYLTRDKDIYYTNKIQVTISYKDIETENFETVRPEHRETILSFVDNKDSVFINSYKENSFENDTYDYLIIAPKNIIDSVNMHNLHTFKTFLETERGHKVKVVDVKEAISQGEGQDDAQKLRSFLRDEYKAHGIKYLLIAGDSDGRRPAIPTRRIYSQIMGYTGTWKKISKKIATDFYYSCLDGTYNYDNDDKWAEPTDGDNGGDVDFLCELTVGRWPIDTSQELDQVVKKSIQAYKELENRSKNVLMLGEHLFKEMGLWGKQYMNNLIGTVDDHDFITNGYNNSWNIDTLYEKDRYWSGSQATKLINANDYLMVNHLGHSNSTMNMKISARQYSGMRNTNHYMFYTQGCYAGDFTVDASIVESMVIKKGGPFAAVANTSYGLGPEDPDPESTATPGTSQILHRHFVNNVLNINKFAFAEAHKKSKEDLLVYIDHPEARWVVWTATYFGEPAIRP